MSVLEIESLLFENTIYSFENDDIEDDDINLETTLHSIKIFNNDYIIAMGKKNIHKNNNNLVYFAVYLIYNSKVITKIGIYELEEKDEEKKNTLTHNNVNFNELQLIIFDKYYQDRKLLEPFKQIIGNMVDTNDESIILVNDNFKFVHNENKQRDLLSSIFIEGFNKDKSNSNFSYSYLNVLRKCELNSTIIVKIKEFIKRVFPKLDKKIVSKLGNYINNPNISIIFFVIMEMILNIKIILVNENNKITQFSLLGVNNVSEDNKKVLENKHTYYKKYNPKKLLFIKKIGDIDNYHILKYNNKYTIDFDNIDIALLNILNRISLKEENEYNYNIQFEYLMNLVKDKNIDTELLESPKEEEKGTSDVEEEDEVEIELKDEDVREGEDEEVVETTEDKDAIKPTKDEAVNEPSVINKVLENPELPSIEDEPIDDTKEKETELVNAPVVKKKSTKQKIMEAKEKMKKEQSSSDAVKIPVPKKKSFKDKVKAAKKKKE